MKIIRGASLLAATFVAGVNLQIFTPAAFAQTPEQFYKGKQIELAIG